MVKHMQNEAVLLIRVVASGSHRGALAGYYMFKTTKGSSAWIPICERGSKFPAPTHRCSGSIWAHVLITSGAFALLVH